MNPRESSLQAPTKRITIVGSGKVAAELIGVAPEYLPPGTRVEKVSTEQCLEHPDQVAAGADLAILCGGRSEAVVEALTPFSQLKLLDVSPTYRWHADWKYGWRSPVALNAIRQAPRVANPGCVATAAILALGPISHWLAPGPLYLDAVGGVSMAGSKPGQVARLSALDAPHPHLREIEIACALDVAKVDLWLHPKVEPSYERGILLTAPLPGLQADRVLAAWTQEYGDDPTIIIDPAFSGRSIPCGFWAGKPGAWMTAIPERGGCLAIVCLDNLLKGAAETALCNAADMLGGPTIR